MGEWWVRSESGGQSHFRPCRRGSLRAGQEWSLGSDKDGLKFSLSASRVAGLGASCVTHVTPSSSPVSYASCKVAVEVKQHFSRHSSLCGRCTLRKCGHISLVDPDGNLELRINNNPRISAGLPWIRQAPSFLRFVFNANCLYLFSCPKWDSI